MQFNLSQNMATFLHLLMALIQVCVVIWVPISPEGKGEFIGFFSLCQAALGYRAFDLTPKGVPVPNPPSKEVVEAQEKIISDVNKKQS